MVRKIEAVSDNSLLVYTDTSVYELQHLGNEIKQQVDGFNMEQILQNPKTPSEVTMSLQEKSFHPVESVEIDGHTFFMSPIISGGIRDAVIGYTFDNESVVQLIMFYQSHSDGGWRMNAPDDNQQLSKGILHKKYGYRHYTRETKPHEDFVAQLDKLPIVNGGFGADSLYEKQRFIRSRYKNQENLSRYITETESGEVEASPIYFDSIMRSGIHVDNRIARGKIYGKQQELLQMESVHNINFPVGFIPDFSQDPKYTYYQSHTLLSDSDSQGRPKQDVRIEVYESVVEKKDGGSEKLRWHMATSQKGKVWVEKIIPESSKVNSFGVYSQVYDFGVLDLKPIDYEQQVIPIPAEYKIPYMDGEDATAYEDITPFLGELLPIKLYKQSRA